MSTEPELIPEELAEICRDDMKEANELMAQSVRAHAAAEAIRDRVERRLVKRLNLLPIDTFDLETRIVTRGKGDEVKP